MTLLIAGIDDKIVFIQNAITNARQKVSMRKPPGFSGNYIVQELNADANHIDEMIIQTALLSDIFDLIASKSKSDHPITVAIKMDIEGSHCKAITGSRHYFEANDYIFINIIIMEWLFEETKENCALHEHEDMINILTKNKYEPWTINLLTRLNPAKAHEWPNMDVVWIHESVLQHFSSGKQ